MINKRLSHDLLPENSLCGLPIQGCKRDRKIYIDVFDMDLLACVPEDKLSSTKEANAYMHVFLDAGM